MDEIAKKKWFLFLNDHQEGPFSMLEIREKAFAGAVPPSAHAWAEGMADWLPLQQISGFQALLEGRDPSQPSMPRPVIAGRKTPPAQPPRNTQAASLTPAAAAQRPAEVANPMPAPISAISPVVEPEALPRRVLWKAQSRRLAIGLGCFVAGAALYTARSFIGKVHWRSRAATRPAGMTPGDFTALQAALEGDSADGLKAAVAVAFASSAAPTFYVASNAPEGTHFELEIDGIPGKVMSSTAVRKQEQVSLVNGIGHTEPSLRPADAFPTGEYRVVVSGGGLQKALAGSYFLGGEKSHDFERGMVDLRRKMDATVAHELAEYRKTQKALRDLLSMAAVRFNAVHAMAGSTGRDLWNDFDHGWTAGASSAEATVKRWSQEAESRPGTIRAELALAAGNAWSTMSDYHDVQRKYFASRSAYDSEWSSRLAEAGAKAVKASEAFKAALDKSEADLTRGGGSTAW